MLLVKHDGKAMYFVAAHPVSLSAFKEMFGGHKQDGKPDTAVTNVSYDEARSYVSSHGGRLLRDAEWDVAAVTPGFVVETDVLEWVEADGDKRVARQHGKHEVKPGKGENDVTFRMAKDL
jgi:formylglycine-generating enzyme required for sulfatase activity